MRRRSRPTTTSRVLSWLFLGGRCRHCPAPISARYPIVEAATAIVFAPRRRITPTPPQLASDLVLAAFLVPITIIDLEHHISPTA